MATKLALFVASLLVPFFAATQEPKQDPKQEPDKKPTAPAPMKAEPADLKKLEWLSGTWAMEKDGTTTEEHWRPLQGTTLMGTSHTFDAKSSKFFEFLRITAMRGTIAYIASPQGMKPTVFPLAKLEDGVVVFENPQHDYPQRIRYEKTDKGVTATISLLDGGKAESFVFTKK